jgi:predicted glycoside hydrolase/deacetylase ChbG (UPF0249 family)
LNILSFEAMTKCIVLCADDYGQAPAISEGILSLIQAGRLSAASCMVNTPFWMEYGSRLKPYQEAVDIGLHFNLTEGKPLSDALKQAQDDRLLPLPILMRRAFLRQLKREAIEAECHAQLDCFEAGLGRLPDFIDGHQHIHQFPVIRDALISVYDSRLRAKKPYVRLVNERIHLTDFIWDMKKIVIYLSGTRALKTLLEAHHIPHNKTFAGIYSFGQASEYGQYFPVFLEEVGDQGLIMCHPGLASKDPTDRISIARFEEYQYLGGHQFLADCAVKQISLRRFQG